MDPTSLPPTGIPLAVLQVANPTIPAILNPTNAPAPVETPQPIPFQEVAANVQATEPAYDVAFTPVTATPVDPNAALLEEDLAARTAEALVAQQSVLNALNSGGDTSVLLSGLPPGATATLLGGGWARVPPGTDPAETAERTLAYFFPFRPQDVPAVASSAKAEAAREQEKRAAEGRPPLKGYSKAGEEEEPREPGDSLLDILD